MVCMSMGGALKWWLRGSIYCPWRGIYHRFFVLESILCSILGNGERIHFWEDFWIGESNLCSYSLFFCFFCF